MYYKKTMKTLVFSLGLAAMTLTTNSLNAQDGGGLFGRGMTSDNAEYSSRDRGLFSINLNISDPLTNGDFGDEDPNPLPLGSGLAILIGAGIGYVAFKKKEDKQ